MAPAWPILRPGGAVSPAMKDTTGFVLAPWTTQNIEEENWKWIGSENGQKNIDELQRKVWFKSVQQNNTVRRKEEGWGVEGGGAQ